MQNYRSSIVEGLIAEGHKVITSPEPKTEVLDRFSDVEAQLKQVAQTKYQAECTHVADANIPTEREYQTLKDKRAKTKEERWIERKGSLLTGLKRFCDSKARIIVTVQAFYIAINGNC